MNQRLLDYLGKEFGFYTTNPKGNWMESTKWNGISFLHGLLTQFKETGDESPYSYSEPEHLGGIIVFSTDVNAVIDKMYPDDPLLKRKALSIWETLKNRIQANKKLTKVLMEHDEVYAFSIGNFFKGRYKSENGSTYDELSKSIEIVGITFELICVIAAEIAREFKQESVLVKDNSSPTIRFVSPK